MSNNSSFDFYPLGQAIKDGRNKQKFTREELAEKLGINDRYLAQIENEGVNPGFELFYTLVTMFDISVDQFFYPDRIPAKSTRRRQIETKMEDLDDTDLIIIEAAANGICQANNLRGTSFESGLTYTAIE